MEDAEEASVHANGLARGSCRSVLTVCLVDTSEDDIGEVREEASPVQDRLHHSRDRLNVHRLGVCVVVPLKLGDEVRTVSSSDYQVDPIRRWTYLESLLDHLHQLLSVRSEPIDGDHTRVGPVKERQSRESARADGRVDRCVR